MLHSRTTWLDGAALVEMPVAAVVTSLPWRRGSAGSCGSLLRFRQRLPAFSFAEKHGSRSELKLRLPQQTPQGGRHKGVRGLARATGMRRSPRRSKTRKSALIPHQGAMVQGKARRATSPF